MSDKIEKASETEIKITSTDEVIFSVADIKQLKEDALGTMSRIEERRALIASNMQKEYDAAQAIVADCEDKLAKAAELGVVLDNSINTPQ